VKTGLWLLLIELAVLTVAAAAAVLFVQWRRARRDRAAVARLVTMVRSRLPERRSGVRDLLGRTGMLGQVLDDATDRILGSELRLYAVCANAYLDRDAGALARLNEAVDAAIAPYWGLGVSAPADADVVVTQPADDAQRAGIDPAEYERLREENQRLSAELQVTLDTMSRMLSEYSAMFAGGADAALDKQKLREMFANDGSGAAAEPPAAGSVASGAGTGGEGEATGGEGEAETAAHGADALPAFADLGDDASDASSRLDDPDLVALDDFDPTRDLADFDAPAADLDLESSGAAEEPDQKAFDVHGPGASPAAPRVDGEKVLG
jgi:hypothetical protein